MTSGKLFLLFVFGIFWSPLYAQNISQCESLKQFLNFPEVIASFHLNEKNDSLILIDKNNSFARDCQVLFWKNKDVVVAFDPVEIEKIKSKDPYIVYKDNCKVFILSGYSKTKTVHSFSILQPCSNLLTEGKMKVVDGKYKLVAIKKYVL